MLLQDPDVALGTHILITCPIIKETAWWKNKIKETAWWKNKIKETD